MIIPGRLTFQFPLPVSEIPATPGKDISNQIAINSGRADQSSRLETMTGSALLIVIPHRAAEPTGVCPGVVGPRLPASAFGRCC